MRARAASQAVTCAICGRTSFMAWPVDFNGPDGEPSRYAGLCRDHRNDFVIPEAHALAVALLAFVAERAK